MAMHYTYTTMSFCYSIVAERHSSISIVLNAWPYFHEEGADLGGCIQCSNRNFEEFNVNSKLLSTLYVRINDYSTPAPNIIVVQQWCKRCQGNC